MAITRSAFEQAARNKQLVASLIEFSAMEGGQQTIDKWLRETGLHRKVRVGVVTIVEDFSRNELTAWAKVVQDEHSGGGSFEHTEPFAGFPSDHFKTKILLVTGGA